MKKLKNKNYFPILIIGGTILILIILLIIKGIMSGASISTYGNRLKGIKDVPFNKNSQKKVTDLISSNEKTSDVNIKIEGKTINIMFNVDESVSVDDAKNIANSSLETIDSKVKSFYDIQVFITKEKEKGTEQDVESTDGNVKTETVKEFPIVGYKHCRSNNLVW